MKREELLKKIAPCSLMCHTCCAYFDGVISKNANELTHYINGLKECYEKNRSDVVENFQHFEQVLSELSNAPCEGCRSKGNNMCSIEGCFLLDCTKEHGVDYCGECNEFPCNKVSGIFEDVVYQQWLNGNQEIKDHGIEEFWEKNCKKPHYETYLKK